MTTPSRGWTLHLTIFCLHRSLTKANTEFTKAVFPPFLMVHYCKGEAQSPYHLYSINTGVKICLVWHNKSKNLSTGAKNNFFCMKMAGSTQSDWSFQGQLWLDFNIHFVLRCLQAWVGTFLLLKSEENMLQKWQSRVYWTSWQVSTISIFSGIISLTFKHSKHHISRLYSMQILQEI